MKEYDLIVIGSGPAGEKAAVKAAYYGKKVAVVEKEPKFGGAGTNTGTLPSKTLKETALYFSAFYERGKYGVDYKFDRLTSAQDFFFRKNEAVSDAEHGIERNFRLHGVDAYIGRGSLADPHTVKVSGDDDVEIRGEHILIATGSYPWQPPGIPFDGMHVHDSDTILTIKKIPKSLVIVGAGVIGCEYATIFSVMGCDVTLINSHEQILGFLDREICRMLRKRMEQDGVRFLFNTRAEGAELLGSNGDTRVHAHLADGKPIEAEMFLYATGRSGATAGMGLEEIGIEVNKRGLISVDRDYRTAIPHIYAVGDVIGFPALASTSMDQGRVAVTHIFGLHGNEHLSEHFPFGIYTIPEVSAYGMTEEEAKAAELDFCVGRAWFRDCPRGRIEGLKDGVLKIIVERETMKVRGVHVFGRHATELIHYGMALVDNEETLIEVVGRVYNVPTLHELYKFAGYNAYIQGDLGTSPVGH